MERSMSLQQHQESLRQPIVQRFPKLQIIVLNSFFKMLLFNEGITIEDDIYRIQNRGARNKVVRLFRENELVQETLNNIDKDFNQFKNNQLVGYLTLLLKTEQCSLHKFYDAIKLFKKNLLETPCLSPGSAAEMEENHFRGQMEGTLQEIGVIYQLAKKNHYYYLQQEAERQEFYQVTQRFIKYCRPIYQENYKYCDLGQLSLIFGSECYFGMLNQSEQNSKILMKRLRSTDI